MDDEVALTPSPEPAADLFAVYAEAQGHTRPLFQIGLTFGRLMDDIVVPYESGEAFFIDGAPVSAPKLTRVKLLKLRDSFSRARSNFNFALTRHPDAPARKLQGEQYTTRFEHMLREHSDDVTSQIIKAYTQAIKPRLIDYLPKRQELLSSALTLFVEGVKALNK